MASISSNGGGNIRIQFKAADGVRKTIHLGGVTQKIALTCKQHIEALLSARHFGMTVDSSTAAWLTNINDDLAAKLARVGLIEPRRRLTLQTFIVQYLASRPELKPSTVTNIDRAGTYLKKYFGPDRVMNEIKPHDAAAFKDQLVKWKYSKATIGRAIRRAKQLFTEALRRQIITVDPFVEVKGNEQTNPDRKYFVDRTKTERMLAAAPDIQWQVIIALSRFGGLRCPSEHVELKWTDIHWDKQRFWVTSPKTEHYAGRAGRWVPLFPELVAILKEASKLAESDTKYVISHNRTSRVNWRTGLMRIIGKAGLTPWPKLFHNLRASRETELAAEFPLHVVTEWIGNSSMIALKHYLTVTDDDFHESH